MTQSNIDKVSSTFDADFETANSDQWKAQLAKDLKGVTFEELIQTDRNGIDIQPFYTQSPENASSISAPVSDWYVLHHVGDGGNAEALKILNNGATALQVHGDETTDWSKLLQDVDLRHIFLKVWLDGDSMRAYDVWNAYYKANYPQNDALLVQILDVNAFSVFDKKININAHIYNNAGAGAALENALILAQLNEALHQEQEKNTLNSISEIHINLAIDTMFFEQISKLRSLRKLTNFVLSKYNIQAKVYLHLQTSAIYLSSADAASNILRNAVAAMAAVVGDCDSLYILPYAFDEKNPDFALRISRNQQLILKEESYFHQVADKAYGSYFVENYTEKISEKSWSIFQSLEQKGGWQQALSEGTIASLISNQQEELLDAYRSGKNLLIGVNKYSAPASASKPLDPSIVDTEAFGIKSINLEIALKA